MTRIVAGAARGRRLAVPPGEATRPTSDRAREGLFSTVTSVLGALAGRRVLDGYAGSGAVGLEALSRGAAHALLVERDRGAVRTLRANVAALGLPGAQVVAQSVARVLSVGPPGGAYDLVFLDPPYVTTDAEVTDDLVALVERAWLTADALVVVERATRGAPLAWPAGLVADRERRYGAGTLWYGRPAPGAGAG